MKLHLHGLCMAFPLLFSCDGRTGVPHEAGSLDVDAGQVVAEPLVTSALCKSVETILFDCQTGETRIAVCGSNEEIEMSPSAIYREDGPDIARLQISAPSRSQAYTATIARTMYSGGGEVQFRFAADQDEYIAYSRTVRSGPDEQGRWVPEHQAGVAHFVDGELIGIRNCLADGGLQVANNESLDEYFEPGEFVYVELEKLKMR